MNRQHFLSIVLAAVVASGLLQNARAAEADTSVTGKVMERWVTTSREGRVHQLAKLRTADGGLVVLDLGAPGGEGTIAAGETVSATGRAGRVDDRPVFVVRAIAEPIPARPDGAPPRQTFSSIDADGSGAISREEAQRLATLAIGFDVADRNRNGSIGPAEFDEAMALDANLYGEGERSAQKRQMFRSLDMDGDGRISRTEARWRPVFAERFGSLDHDRDGFLDQSEFGLASLGTLARPTSPAAAGGSTGRRGTVFHRLDRDRDGYLSDDELWSGPTIDSSWMAIDRDEDERIAPGEFSTVPDIRRR